MAETSIEWTDKVWNPVTGCRKISPGCAHCYAETIAKRFWKGRAFTDVRTHADRLEQPLHWKKPCRIFVNSMSDLFHEDVPFSFIDSVFRVMIEAKQHTFQVLTKRAARMAEYCCNRWGVFDGREYPMSPTIWLGVSVEDEKRAEERLPHLRKCPAAVRFVSYEPALGGVEWNCWLWDAKGDCKPFRIPGIDWMICGGESGPGARPMHPAWARTTRDQCQAAGVPFFFKQWGEWQNGSEPGRTNWIVLNDGRALSGEDAAREHLDEAKWSRSEPTMMARVGKKAAGDLLDGVQWHQFPEVPHA